MRFAIIVAVLSAGCQSTTAPQTRAPEQKQVAKADPARARGGGQLLIQAELHRREGERTG